MRPLQDHVAPLLDELARQRTGELLVAKLNTDTNPASAADYEIRGIHTLILFRDGKEAGRRTGAISGTELEALLA